MGDFKSITNKEKAFYCYFIQTIYTNLLNNFEYKTKLTEIIEKTTDQKKKRNISKAKYNIENIDSVEQLKKYFNDYKDEITEYYNIKKEQLEVTCDRYIPEINDKLFEQICACRNFCSHENGYTNNDGVSNLQIIKNEFGDVKKFREFMNLMIVLLSNIENTRRFYKMSKKYLTFENEKMLYEMQIEEYCRTLESNLKYIKMMKPKYNIQSEELIYQIFLNDGKYTDIMFYDICLKLYTEKFIDSVGDINEFDCKKINEDNFTIIDVMANLNNNNTREKLKKNYGNLALNFKDDFDLLFNKSDMIIILLIELIEKDKDNSNFDLVQRIKEIYDKELKIYNTKMKQEELNVLDYRVKLYLKIVNMLNSDKDVYFTYFEKKNDKKIKLNEKLKKNEFDVESVNKHVIEIFKKLHGDNFNVDRLIEELNNRNNKTGNTIYNEYDALILLDIANRLKLLNKENDESYYWMRGHQKRKKIIGLINKLAVASGKQWYQKNVFDTKLNALFRSGNSNQMIEVMGKEEIKYLDLKNLENTDMSTNDLLNYIIEDLYNKRNIISLDDLIILLNIRNEYIINEKSIEVKYKKVTIRNKYYYEYIIKNINDFKEQYINKIYDKNCFEIDNEKDIRKNYLKMNSKNIIRFLVCYILSSKNEDKIKRIKYYSFENPNNNQKETDKDKKVYQNIYFETIVLISNLLMEENKSQKNLQNTNYIKLKKLFIKKTRMEDRTKYKRKFNNGINIGVTNSDYRELCKIVANVLSTNMYTIDINEIDNNSIKEIVEGIKTVKHASIVPHIETIEFILNNNSKFSGKDKFLKVYRNKVLHNQKIALHKMRDYEIKNQNVEYTLENKSGRTTTKNANDLNIDYGIVLYDEEKYYNLICTSQVNKKFK